MKFDKIDNFDEVDKIEEGKYWHRFWTIPNAFTLLRIASSVGLVTYLGINGLNPLTCFGVTSNFWLPSWAIVTAATDFVDGSLARKLHQQSKWGQALDPIADKVQNWGIALTLMASGIMPLWVLTIGARDLAVGIFTATKKYKDGKRRESEKKEKLELQHNKEKKSTLDKWKERFSTFKKGEAPSPTFPAKMKMALQSVGAIATLAFGFGSCSFSLLGSVMAGSIATMMIPKALPLSDRTKKCVQFLSTVLVTSLGTIFGGVTSIAPVMMATAISMVVPEIFSIRKEYFNTPHQEEKEHNEQSNTLNPVTHDDSNKENVKEKVLTASTTPTKKPDYSKIDQWIEQEMLKQNQEDEEKDNHYSYQKRIK